MSLKVEIRGHIGQNPQLTTLPSGNEKMEFSIASTDRYTDKDGNRHERTSWFRIIAWNAKAKYLKTCNAHKGTFISGWGRIEIQSYTDSNGQPRQTAVITIDEFNEVRHTEEVICPTCSTKFKPSNPARSANETTNQGSAPQAQSAEGDEDLPF